MGTSQSIQPRAPADAEDVLSAIFEELSEIVWRSTRAGDGLLLNGAACTVLGWDCSELRRDIPWWQQIVHPEDHKAFSQSLEQVDGGRSVEHSYRVVTPAGETRLLRGTTKQLHGSLEEGDFLLGIAVDATARPQTGQGLNHLKEGYQTLADSLPLNLLLKDAQGRRTFANRRYLDLHNCRLEEVVGKTDFDLFPESLVRKFSEDDSRVLRTGEVLRDIEELQTPDGGRRWIERVKSPVRDAEGRIVGVQLLFWDVSDQKQVEAALNHERFLLHVLLENIPDSLYFKDRESRFLRISRSMAQKFHLRDPGEAEGKSDADIFTEEHAAQARADELRVMETGEPVVARVEKETWPDQEDTWCSTTKMPLHDRQGKVVGTFGISRDITELKRVEDALQRERDLLRTLIDRLPDLVFAKDIQGRFLMANQAIATFIGVERPVDVIGRTDRDFFAPELAAHFIEDDRRVMETASPLIDREESVIDRDGHPLWLLTSKVPLRNANGDVIGLVGIGRNVTRLKSAQQQSERQALEARLLHQATAMAAETSSLDNALQACVDSVCELAGWPFGCVYLPAGDGEARAVPGRDLACRR